MGLEHNIVAAVISILSRLLSRELEVGSLPTSRWLIRWAARRLPISVRERYESEWLGHLEELQSPVRRLSHAVTCAMRIRVIARACLQYEIPLEELQKEAPSVIAYVVAPHYHRASALLPAGFENLPA